jgi:hypothetical protein
MGKRGFMNKKFVGNFSGHPTITAVDNRFYTVVKPLITGRAVLDFGFLLYSFLNSF